MKNLHDQITAKMRLRVPFSYKWYCLKVRLFGFPKMREAA